MIAYRAAAPALRVHRGFVFVAAVALSALLAAVVLTSDAFVRTAPGRVPFLERTLGAPRVAASPVRRPARAITVQIDRQGYRVAAVGQGVVGVAVAGAGAPWKSFAGGAARPTAFGAETVTVGADRTEEYLTVMRRQGVRTWRWRLVAPRLRPRLERSGAIALSPPGASPELRIAPVRILDAAGALRTPPGLHWHLGRDVRGTRWLELRLDDRDLPLPYVIDPAVDYPSPLYLSSTHSTELGSWQLVTTAPAGADSTTTTTPASAGTGYYLFKPGLDSTSAGTPRSSPAGAGFVQDLSGATGFPAGGWSFTVETQAAGSSLVSGTAILAIGVWKGTISRKGVFKSTQVILPPTDDPAAQNIRRSLGALSTTVSYSLPAFTLDTNDRLYVEIWRRQVTGITSSTSADRRVSLVVNDGVSRIVHPAADDTSPTNAFQVANATGGVYFDNPGGSTGTVYYRGSAAGSFNLQDGVTDAGSGAAQVTYPALVTSGWTHPAETVTSAPSFQSSTYSWTAGATTSPGAQAIVAQDGALNSTTGSPVTITNDTTAPTTPAVALTSPPPWYAAASVALAPTDGTDFGSGLDTTSRVYQRDEAPLTGGACGLFPGNWGTAVSSPDTTVQNGRCYRYRLLESDRVGNQSAASAPSDPAKIDLQPPAEPTLVFSALTNAAAAGSTLYYRPTANGSFTVTASSTDGESGIAGYAFPTPPTWTVTGSGAARTYAWSGTPTPPGTLSVRATDLAGNTGPGGAFTPTPDSVPPSTTDDTTSIGPGWSNTNQSVTLTPTDDASGVAATYYTTDGSAPTTSSPSGTSIGLTGDGSYTIRYFSVDRVGNAEGVETAAATVDVDKTPGTATLGALPSVVRNGQILTATAADATSGVASVAYYLCNPSPCTPTTLVGSSTTAPSYAVTWSSQPADGTYDLVAKVTDNAGNVGSSPKTSVTVDSTPPDTTITAQPVNPSNVPSPSFSFASSESGSTFECKLDAGVYAACTSPYALSGLADGPHGFSVRATDVAGNVDTTPATVAWTVDTTPPDTSITGGPPDPSLANSAEFSFTSADGGASFECALDGVAYASCISPTSLTGLANGGHSFSVRAVDAAGNTDPSPAAYEWTVSSTLPDTTITSQPPNPSRSPGASFGFGSTVLGSTFECRLDAGAFAPCTSPTEVSVSEGSHTFAVRAVDPNGNADPTPATYTWTFDATAPDTTITAQPSDPAASSSASFSFASSEVGSTFQCTLDGAASVLCSSPTTLASLPDGSHTFSVAAVDPSGNTDATPATATWTVDTTAPETTITAQPADPSSLSTAGFSFTSSETGSTFECRLDGGAYAGCTSPHSLTDLQDGGHTFAVRAVDPAGNVDPTSASYAWTVAIAAPDTTIATHPPDPANTASASFGFTATPAGSTFLCQLDGAAAVSCSSPQTYLALADGQHTFTVQAVDSTGNADPTPATYPWTVDTVSPDTTITTEPPSPSGVSSPSFSFASSESPSTFECDLDGQGYVSCVSPDTFADLADGSHVFSVRATDAAGNTDGTPATYAWSIDTSATSSADEIHYTFTGPTSVAFDWRGNPNDIRYGLTSAYGSSATAHTPSPLPFSSEGPFWEVELSGLAAGTTYHYSIGGGPDNTFSTAPTGDFRFDVLADVGSSLLSSKVGSVAAQIAGDAPAFVLVPGDLTYANASGQSQASVDRHFDDVMPWSTSAAYMPSWGNHEWETPALDDLRNYKGRFMLPNAQAVPSAPPGGCCGEDWGWFDAGGVRFISYPEIYHTVTVSEWQTAADAVFAAAEADPSIHFIVTYGHEPAYSTGFHTPVAALATALDSFGDRYSKYVLNLNGHNHDYERFQPIHGVTHITTGAATSMETPWVTTDSRVAFRAFHLEHLRVDVTSTGMQIDVVCGPASSSEDTTCAQGAVLDSIRIGEPPPPTPPAPIIYVDQTNPFCTDTGSGSADQPFCTIGAATSRVNPGQTVQVASGTYPESVTVPTSATATAPIVIAAAPGASVLLQGGTTGFTIANKSYVTIRGFTISGTSGVGISVSNSSNVAISNNHVSGAGQQVSGQTKSGIYLNTVRDSTVTGNTVDHNTSYGIYLNGSTNNLIKDNETFSNAQGFQRAASGIRLYNSSSNTIDSNRTHDNEDSGIESFTSSNDNLIVNNVSYDNGDHGIDNYASTGQRIFGNSVYHNVTAGINIEGGSAGATIANNVSVDNGISSPRTHSDIRVENGSTSGTTLDYDVVFLTTPDTLLIWNSVQYSSLQAFQAASGQELHGIQADPKWANVAARDFHLTAGSPAIDSANAGVNGQPAVDVAGDDRVDDPRVVDTGAGSPSYVDRGAFELQAPLLDHVTVSPTSATIQAGTSQSFTVQGYDPGGASLGDVTLDATFSIAPDGSCTGNVCTATKAGAHTVTASDRTTNATKTATATVLVTASTLDHLAVSPPAATIRSGTSQPFAAEGRDVYDNSLGDVTATTAFAISPDGSCEGASCTASIAGAHTVTATKGGKTGTASLTVLSGTLDHIVIAPGAATVAAGGAQAYTAEGFDAAGNRVGDVTGGTTFSISAVGTCTGNVCSAQSAGPHIVTGNNGGKTSTGTLSVTSGALDHLAVSPSSTSMTAGSSQAFTAQARDRYDNALGDATSSTTFSIAPDGTCTGNSCTATSAGPHTVTATSGGATGISSMSIDAGALDHLVLSPATAGVPVGSSQSYTADGRDAYGNDTGDVTDAATFTIAPEGSCSGATCSAGAAGPHTVTASVSSATGTASLQGLEVARIVIAPTEPTIEAGGEQPFTATGYGPAGNSLGDVTSQTTFSISPDGSCSGNVCTANHAWPHTVTANDAGETSSTNMFVTPSTIDHLVLTADASSVTAGTSEGFEADGRDRFDNSLGDVTQAATFSIAPDGSCSGATCTATVSGPHTVTAMAEGKTGTYALYVTPGDLDHLALTPASQTVASGSSQQYTAEARDAYDNVLGDVTGDATFSIMPDGMCAANVCSAVAQGGHIVSATFVGAVGTASLTVLTPTVDHIAISPATASITAGGSRAFTAQAFDADGNALGDVTSSTSFTVSPDGSCTGNTCTATAAGPHTVTGDAAGKTATASLVVDPGALDHLLLTPTSSSIITGGSQAYTADARDRYGNSLGDVTATTAFSIAPDGSCAVATCTASTAGPHTVTGTSSGKSGTAALFVGAGTLDHISISPASASMTAGASKDYTAQAFDAANNPLGDVTAQTTFTIGPDGSCSGSTCTATVAGTHTVTADDGGKTATASLTVGPGGLDHLALTPATASISAGGSQAYTAQGRDRYDNSLGDVTSSTTFSIGPNGSCSAATCTAATAGAHTVTGSAAGKAGTASLTVAPGPLDHIVLGPSSATITAGGSQSFSAQGFDDHGNSLGDVTSATTFTVLPNGSCTGNTCTSTAAGSHTVTGNDAGKTGTSTLAVNAGPLDHLALSPTTATIAAGGSQVYAAEGRDRYDNPLGDLTAGTTFAIAPDGSCSAATCTASVSGAHTVTGTDDGTTGTATLQVSAGALDHIALTPTSVNLESGGSQAFTATGFDSLGNALGDVTASTTFSIAPDGSCGGNVCSATTGGWHTVTGTSGGRTSTASVAVDFVKNFGFESDLSGWNTSGSGSGVTLARIAGGHSGGWSVAVANGGTSNQSCVLNDSPDTVKPTPAGTFTGSIWVRGDRAGVPFKLRFREYSTSGTLLGTATTQVTLSGAWQQATVTYTVTSPGSSLDFNAYLSSADAPPGTCFYADDAGVFKG